MEGVNLSLNAVKSIVILFSRRFAPPPPFKVLINGVSIPCTKTVAYLGFFIDAQLNWQHNIIQKCAAVKRALFSVNNCL
jgi:hypothetical protein